jgi:hypothetical protein
MIDDDLDPQFCATCSGETHEASGVLRLSGSPLVLKYRSIPVRRKAGTTFVLDRFDVILKHSPHSLKQIISTVNDAVEEVFEKMRWAPLGLQISINGRQTRTMGASFYARPEATVRRI